MRKLWIVPAAALLLVTAIATNIPAQEDEPEMYARSFYIQRVFPNRNGYRLIYTNDHGRNQELLVPLRWFGQTANEQTAELRRGRNPSYPYMEVFWRDGEFSHMKIYLQSDYNHESWGIWDAPDNVDELFDLDEPDFNL